MSEKRKSVVDDVQGDLKAVGGFFKKIWQATERAERGVEAARKDPLDDVPPGSSAAKRIKSQRAAQVIDVKEGCGVCGGTRLVGAQIKVACPACTPKR
jgi:hypothetical protein